MEDESTGLTLDKALRAHQQWKAQLQLDVLNKDTLDVHRIMRDDCCELGKWLLSDGRRLYGPKPEFSNLLARHMDFHHTAGFIAKLINARKSESALSHLGTGSQFAFASMEVSLAIDQLKAAVALDGQ